MKKRRKKLTGRGEVTSSTESSISSTDDNHVVNLGTGTQLSGGLNDTSTLEATVLGALGPVPGVSVVGPVDHIVCWVSC